MSSIPNRATVPLLSDADLYDQKRDEGLSHDQAVQAVEARRGGRDISAQASVTERPNRFARVSRVGEPAPATNPASHSDPRTGLPIPVAPPGQGVKEATQFARLVAHDAPLMFGDEIIGAARGALSPDMTVQEGIAAERKAVEDASGGIKTLAAATSALLPAKLLTGAAQGANRFARLLTGATAGGAAAGAGATEGGLGERAVGAGVGGTISLLTAGLIKGGGALGRKLLDVAGRPTEQAASAGGKLLARAGVQTAEERQLARYAKRLEDAGKTSADVVAAGQSRKPFTAMDVGGESTLGLARGTRVTPGPGKTAIPEALYERAAGAEERVIGDLLETTGTGSRTNTFRRSAERLKSREAAARPLYEEAHSAEVKDERLRKFFKIDEFQEAYKEAQDLARLEGVDIPPIETLIDEGGAVPVRSVDFTKRALDDMIDRLSSGPTNRRSKAAVLRRLKNEMLEVTDELVPKFKEARTIYKGESDLNEALESGRGALKMHPDEIGEYLRNPKLTQGEREEFRTGALEALIDRIEGKVPGASPARGVAEKTLDQKRLRQLFADDKAFEDFRGRLAEEVQLHRGKELVMGGSQTDRNLMEIADLFDVLPSPSQMTSGRGLLAAALEKAGQAASKALPGARQQATAMSSILTRSGSELEELARRLEAFGQREAARAVRAQVGRTAAGIGAASAVTR